jgi:RNAse (barnase) inhibitor barstar
MPDLTSRLPPAILEYDRWRDLFEVIDAYWESRVSSSTLKLKNLLSVFTAGDEQLNSMLAELTAYFDEASEKVSKPLSIFWKKAEIRNKNREQAIDALLQRIKIATKDIKFQRMWAPLDTVTHPYGTAFFTEQQLTDMGADFNDYFLSSHVTLDVSKADYAKYGWSEEQTRSVLERYFKENIRPTHIVFDGLNFFIHSTTRIHVATGTQTHAITVCRDISELK